MDSQDLHELAISYCETIFRGKKVSPKAYIQEYFKAIHVFEKQLNKQIDEDIGGIEVINEIQSNISALEQRDEEDEKDEILF